MPPTKRRYPFVIFENSRPRFSADQTFPCIALWRDGWDDFGNKTLFIATLYLSLTEDLYLGPVKIAVGADDFRPKVPSNYSTLPPDSYSLGQSISYYRKVSSSLTTVQQAIYLHSMNDCVALPSLSAPYEASRVWEKSILRSSAAVHALKRGGYYTRTGRAVEVVTPPEFVLELRIGAALKAHSIPFDFSSTVDGLPHRVNLLVGKNGTGKTTTLATLAYRLAAGPNTFLKSSLSGVAKRSRISQSSSQNDDETGGPNVSQVIAISYNAFDEFPLPAKTDRAIAGQFKTRLNYKYCGLRNLNGKFATDEIVAMWSRSLEPINANERDESLRKLLRTLLPSAIVGELMDGDEKQRRLFFKKLSAGQRLVVSIFADIVAFIEEGSILLVDEPETHLHPGLLSSIYLALSDLLEEYDSYAIIATHSPVILQNIPSEYVRFLKRQDDLTMIVPLTKESLGEDYGELYREVFGLGNLERDYTEVLDSLHLKFGTAKMVQRQFRKPLGFPALSYLMSLDEAGDN